jgi:regulator of protease activity HflC (stomatin/prohibitin superfamily)
MSQELSIRGASGWGAVIVLILGMLGSGYGLVQAARTAQASGIVFWTLLLVLLGVCFAGLTVVNPNEAKVVTLFGVYKGSIKVAGFWWVNPLTTRRRLSLRVRNFESGKLKVNDYDGNPIEIAAVAVWRIVETFEACSTSTTTSISSTSRPRRPSASWRPLILTMPTRMAACRCVHRSVRSPSDSATRSRSD